MRVLDSALYRSDLQRACGGLDFSAFAGKIVAVTGGLGLIGSAVVDLLLTSGVPMQIRILARNQEKFEEKYAGRSNVTFVRFDALRPELPEEDPDYVIYGAGLASPELYVRKPVETMLSNLQGLQAMLERGKGRRLGGFVYISSSEVYGKTETGGPFREGTWGTIDADALRASYAEAKRSAEMLCRAYCAEYGVPVVIVRPGHIYGPTISRDDKRISSEFAWKAARGEPLTMKSPGLQRRSYCYCVDCAAAVVTVLLHGTPGEAYNIGSERVITIREMAQLYAAAGAAALDAAEPTEEERSAFNPMNDSSLNDEKIRALGYRSRFSPEEGLDHTVRILRQLSEKEEGV